MLAADTPTLGTSKGPMPPLAIIATLEIAPGQRDSAYAIRSPLNRMRFSVHTANLKTVQDVGTILPMPILGGLHHHYVLWSRAKFWVAKHNNGPWLSHMAGGVAYPPPSFSADYTDDQKKAADEFVAARKVPVFGPFEPLMHSPQVMTLARSMGDYLSHTTP